MPWKINCSWCKHQQNGPLMQFSHPHCVHCIRVNLSLILITIHPHIVHQFFAPQILSLINFYYCLLMLCFPHILCLLCKIILWWHAPRFEFHRQFSNRPLAPVCRQTPGAICMSASWKCVCYRELLISCTKLDNYKLLNTHSCCITWHTWSHKFVYLYVAVNRMWNTTLNRD